MSKEGIRTIMATSGMPHKWWPHAAEFYSFAKNTLVVEGDSPYNRRLKRGHCKALRIPFGALIQFMPNPAKMKDIATFSSKLVPGIFLGWDADPGGKWSKSYVVISVEDALGSNTHNSRVQNIQRIREVEIPRSISYPLYDKECAKAFVGSKPSTWQVEPVPASGSVTTTKEAVDTPMHLKEGYMISAYKVGNMNFDRYDNRIIRKYAGSKRPPHIWPEDWQKMTPKEKTAELLQYQKGLDPTLTGGASSSNSPAMPSPVTLPSRRGARQGPTKTNCCRHIIEWCCGENSLIGSVKLNKKTPIASQRASLKT
jgi:hypothetical protein